MAKGKQTAAERFASQVEKQKQDGSLQIDAAKLELSEQIFFAMEERGISEAEFARRLVVSRAYVNKVLQGSANLTIESLVKIGLALDAEFKFAFSSGAKTSDLPDAEIIYSKEKRNRIAKATRFPVRNIRSEP